MRDECYYCKREIQHGGKCQGKDGPVPCLAYEKDPRGRRKWLKDLRFDIPLGKDIPKIHEPCGDWQLDGIDKTITFVNIHKVEWHRTKKALQGIRLWADIWYWSHENGELPPEKPKLRLIKTGGKENAR